MVIPSYFKSLSIDNELVREVDKRKIARIDRYNKVKDILDNLTYYKLLGLVYYKTITYNQIAEGLGIDPKNLTPPLQKMRGKVPIGNIRTHFIKMVKHSHKDIINLIDYRGILNFIVNYMLETPNIFNRGVNNDILKQFRNHFIKIGKYYSLNDLFHSFIYNMSQKAYDPLKEKSSDKIIDPGLLRKICIYVEMEEEVIKCRVPQFIEENIKYFNSEELFYLSCKAYILQKNLIL